jgi:DNA-binding response OmpR family regulator
VSGKRRTILVVDDDERVLLALEAMLENESYDTTLAWSGKEGLRLLRDKHFDLVLLDCYLAGFDSREILRAAQEADKPSRVVLMKTGPGRCEIATDCAELGAMDFIDKRSGESEILQVIDACFARSPMPECATRTDWERQGF